MDLAPEALLSLAQIALGFAGFTSIIVIFKRDPTAPWSGLDAFRTARMLSASLAALFFSLLPEALFAMGLAQALVWRSGSALMFGYFLVSGRTIGTASRDLPEAERMYLDRRLAIPMAVLVVSTMLLQGLNALGIWWQPAYWAYYAGIFVLLSMSGFQFVRIVFVRPGQT